MSVRPPSSRALALGGLLLALLAYGAYSEHLFGLPTGLDVVFQGVVVFPAFAAVIWLALPLARARSTWLLVAGALAALVAVACILLDLDSAANIAKLVSYSLLGYWFLSLFEELWWVTAVALLVPWVDVWSVATGPTKYVLEEEPQIFDRVSVAFPNPGENTSVNVGPPDILFFALFLATAYRYRLRVAWTWICMTAFLAGTLALVWAWDDVSGLPALPAVCLGFLVPNADLLLENARSAWRARREATES